MTALAIDRAHGALATLRAATEAVHLRLHRSPSFACIVDGSIGRDEYRALLARLHRFHAPLDRAFAERADDCAQVGMDVRAHSRIADLQADLAALAVPIDADRRARAAIEPSTTAALLGQLYVRDGSYLGGRILHRHLDALFGDDPVGRRFFAGRPGDAGRWRETIAAIERFAAGDDARLAALVAGALACFAAFERVVS